MRSARPRRRSPAQASSVASATPSSSLRSRVSTLPRIGTTLRSGRTCSTWACRRSEEVATVAPFGRSASDRGLAADEGIAHVLARQQAGDRSSPAGSSVGMSFMECTARSISPASRASSSSLVNRPLPPASASGRSWMRSPVVLMARTSNACAPAPCAASSRARTSRGLRQRERRAAGADSYAWLLARAILPVLGDPHTVGSQLYAPPRSRAQLPPHESATSHEPALARRMRAARRAVSAAVAGARHRDELRRDGRRRGGARRRRQRPHPVERRARAVGAASPVRRRGAGDRRARARRMPGRDHRRGDARGGPRLRRSRCGRGHGRARTDRRPDGRRGQRAGHRARA